MEAREKNNTGYPGDISDLCAILTQIIGHLTNTVGDHSQVYPIASVYQYLPFSLILDLKISSN